MALTHTIGFSSSAGGKSESASISLSNSQEVNIEEPVPDGQTDYVIQCTALIAKIVKIWMISDQVVTVKTNSNGSPAETFALVAGQPVLWFTGAKWTNPFGTNLTSLHVANASGVTANLSVKILLDGS